MIVAGMDEAGRGPALGPIVFGLVLATDAQIEELVKIGVDDSKKLSTKNREYLYTQIKKIATKTATFHYSAKEIDKFRQEITMNQLEIKGFRTIIKPHAKIVNVLQLDAADVDEERFGNQFSDLINGEIISEHKGDHKYPIVGAASILAKVTRDQIIKKHQDQMNEFDPKMPSFGSGYPTSAKPFLESFVKKYKKLPEFARASWKTCSSVIDKYTGNKQTSLLDFD